ncbi:Retrotransposable element Tf2 protein type 1 [Aphis craccivora]|uniref:Retrotransposable element Tf2 protein type 1 n=1 Tax=Aphis craccivora TaxID=307492 RepID=A0A6G0Y1F4_APHCR|nr:Retrotransposable element Tf2 protein type 1 [Aphis craccivora]
MILHHRTRIFSNRIWMQEYIPGKENIGADTLSRYPQSPEDQYIRNGSMIAINKLLLTESKVPATPTTTERRLYKIRKLIQQTYSADIKYFIIEKGLLFVKSMSDQHRIMIQQNMSIIIFVNTNKKFQKISIYC